MMTAAAPNLRVDGTPCTDHAADYFGSRQAFTALAGQVGARLYSYPIAATGANGEALTLDVAALGPTNAKRALVVSSGLHGVEGFLGAAVQCQALANGLLTTPPRQQRVVLIHALNPYGFAHLRRVNEDNVDLNRNFLPPEQFAHAPAAPEDPALAALLNPTRHLGVADGVLFPLSAAALIARRGMASVRQAVAQGQYSEPHGLFYGGRSICESTRILRANLAHWLGGAARVLHLDIHTGLGKPGQLKLLLDEKYGVEAQQVLNRVFADEATIERHDASGGAYQATGTLAQWCAGFGAKGAYRFLCAEFGTYSGLRVLQALRAENSAHHWAEPSSRAWSQAKLQLRECFFPKSTRWRTQATQRGLNLVQRACTQAW